MADNTSEETGAGTLTDRAVALGLQGLIRAAHLRRYEARIPMVGALARRIIAPAAGYRRRSLAHLAAARPDLSLAERRRISDEVADNFGRTFAEIFSGAEFTAHVRANSDLTGPGLDALFEAQEAGRPVILAVSHLGNFCAINALLTGRGIAVGSFYRPPDNPSVTEIWEGALRAIASPIFPRTRKGMALMLRFVKGGGALAIGVDQHVRDGARLTFFGRPARTAITAAELALRHDVPLIPVHGLRRPDGLTFEVRANAPIPHGAPAEMMQAVNDDLEATVRDHMGQWLWIHRRWKHGAPD